MTLNTILNEKLLPKLQYLLDQFHYYLPTTLAAALTPHTWFLTYLSTLGIDIDMDHLSSSTNSHGNGNNNNNGGNGGSGGGGIHSMRYSPISFLSIPTKLSPIILPPLWVNITSALLTVFYLNVVMEVASFIRSSIGNTVSRKLIHVCASLLITFWPLFDVNHWSWRLNILVPAAMSVKLFYKGLILNDPNDIDVQNISRSSSPSELLYGPLQFVILMMWLGTCKYMTTEGVIIMAALGIGDGIAPIVGRYYGRMRYKLHPLANEKSVEGSFFGVFLGTVLGCYFFLYMLQMPMIPMQTLVHYGIVATLAEATSPGDWDNVFIPLVIHLSFFR